MVLQSVRCGDGLKLVEKVFGLAASEAAGKVNAVTGNLPPVAPEVIAATEAETEADRKAAAALAVRLMENTRPASGNAYLTRKGFPTGNVRYLRSCIKPAA